MKLLRASSLSVFFLLGLAACGSGPGNLPVAPSVAFDYAPSTVDRLMEECLPGATVAACTCLIDTYRQELSEERVLADGAARASLRAEIASRCGLGRESRPVTSVNTSSDMSDTVSELSSTQGSLAESRALPSEQAATIRSLNADSPEVCLQNKLTEAQKGGSVPIEDFERFQRECGL
jgi:hypothetical protein